jgi:hypothetical protein
MVLDNLAEGHLLYVLFNQGWRTVADAYIAEGLEDRGGSFSQKIETANPAQLS